MTKEEFQDLLKRYTAGKCSLEEIEKVNQWFTKIADDNRELNEFEKSHVSERILAKIRQKLPSASPGRPVKRNFVPTMLKIAASILLVAIAGYYLLPEALTVKPSHTAQSTSTSES